MTTDNIQYYDLTLYWSLQKNEPVLYDQIKSIVPDVALLEHSFLVPAQKEARITNAQKEELAFRPQRHWRAFYLDLKSYNSAYTGYLALKGTEALANNIPELIKKIKSVHSIFSWSTRKSGFSVPNCTHALVPMDDRFLFIENKIPLLYSLKEAITSTHTCIELQKAYINSYKTLAKIPIPLAIYTIPKEKLNNLLMHFRNFYDSKRFTLIEELIGKGLAVQLYWYPIVPNRVAYIDCPSATSLESFHTRIDYLASIMEIEQCIESWLISFCRFLNLGFLLSDPTSSHQGYCLDPGNLVLDGGIVDIDNVRTLDSFNHLAEAQFVFENTVKLMHEAIMALLIGEHSMSLGFQPVFPDMRQTIYTYITEQIRIDTEHQRFVHPMLKQLLAPEECFGMIKKLSSFFDL